MAFLVRRPAAAVTSAAPAPVNNYTYYSQPAAPSSAAVAGYQEPGGQAADTPAAALGSFPTFMEILIVVLLLILLLR